MSKTFLLDGRPVPFEDGQSVLAAARKAGHYIPHLCWYGHFPPHGSCKLCVVKIGARHVSACATPARVSTTPPSSATSAPARLCTTP